MDFGPGSFVTLEERAVENRCKGSLEWPGADVEVDDPLGRDRAARGTVVQRFDHAEEIKESTLADDRPDAAATPNAHRLVALIHGGVLALIVVFVGWAIIQPWLGSFATEKGRAKVRLVARQLVELPAPVAGRAVAVKALAHGDQVRRGQDLLRIEPRLLTEKLNSLRPALQSVVQRQLVLDDRHDQWHGIDEQVASAIDREIREASFKALELQTEIDSLEKLERQLILRSPADGMIHFGLRESFEVSAHQTAVHIFPENGELLVEVEAPLEVIHRLVKSGRVDALLSTTHGEVLVTATPAAATIKSFTTESSTRKEPELWGVIQCVPTNVPESIRSPGLIGRLE